jgi:hypothetical protein
MNKRKAAAIITGLLLIGWALKSLQISVVYPEMMSLLPQKKLWIELRIPPPLCSPNEVQFWAGNQPLASHLLPSQNDSPDTFKFELDLKSAPDATLFRVQHHICWGTQIQLVHESSNREELSSKILNSYLTLHPPDSISYNWTSSVLLYGIVQYTQDHPDQKEALLYLDSVFQGLNSLNLKVTSPDLAAMALPATAYKKLNPKADVDSIFDNTLHFLKTEPVNGLGALNHVGAEHRFYPFLPKTRNFVGDSIWVDSIVMYALTSLRLSEQVNNLELLNFAIKQPLIFSEKLQQSNGLFKHAYYFEKQNLTPVNSYWARGNGWMATALM